MNRLTQVASAVMMAMAAGGSLPAQAAERVKVGFLTTLSGPASAPGVDEREGFMLAMKMLGNQLGGVPAEVIVVDDQFSPDAAKQGADRLIKREKVDILSGLVYSNILLAVAPAAFASKTVVVSANAGPAQLAGALCHPYFFSASYQNDAAHEAAGKLMADKGYQRVAIIAPNYPAGKDASAGFKRFLKKEPTLELFPKLGQLDFATEIAQLRAANIDALYFFLPGGMGVNFVKQYAAAGMDPRIVRVMPAYDADQQMLSNGDLIAGVANTGQWSADLPNEQNRAFVAAYLKEYGRQPSMYASQAYDAAMLIDSAVKAIGGKVENREALIAAIKTANFKSVRGGFRFAANHFPIQNQYARVVTKGADGKYVNNMTQTLLTDHVDAYVGQCKMQ
ncbi:ABC transporter substrate-binding protein [Herbaspirillum rubrisubalbicans]|uniref:ABC transporter substrate-binding protein n=2 Tax=Herbaspirillum rubrisubalbicans TaxID=80842 RepID=A0ABX9BUQ5_9BURK|nr:MULTISPECIES: ABC transporter substrate-binding protein [Herbaspirillum]MCP1574119.1 branched-chain amino acid transport system substrate-binding protein [Herbaspirillum rubrisubalbicans]QJQ02642.1 ABC transporter substrate-binding protein [Herbaspirillum rubrisubalbicans Os34]RAM61488.1 ABC transporter substrate-binding protein [Herbaspirillum rubrisubalbicans]RAN43590.1 ABC transporter substrate-binding protein [Herbaspirillum rubrisubalbicans]